MLIKQHLQNQKGMAALEIIPITIIVVLLLSFSFGFFGVIHTGILNSMAARNYAFETFNHRTDLRYRRSTVGPISDSTQVENDFYYKDGFRIHAITSDKRRKGDNTAIATTREIAFGWDIGKPDVISDTGFHNAAVLEIKDDGTRYTTTAGVNPVWIQTSYGICLTRKCEPN